MRSFFDTNVLAYTDDAGEPEKQAAALKLHAACHRRGQAVVSTQVLQEYFVTVTRKMGVDPVIARRKIELYGRMNVVVNQLDDVLAAVDLARLHTLSFWDALIVRAAQQGECRVIYSEDMQHGWKVDGIEVVNPFAEPA
ncbi:MAG: PIN domain-containing protein [Spirochaetaceae bacterium]|nr:PIN domain-containing protein [Spirochaetaceae bacterium]